MLKRIGTLQLQAGISGKFQRQIETEGGKEGSATEGHQFEGQSFRFVTSLIHNLNVNIIYNLKLNINE